MMRDRSWRLIALPAVLTVITACSPQYAGTSPVTNPKDTAESNLGERLFRDPRFSKFFVLNSHGDVNAELVEGDPAVSREHSARRGEFPNPFAGQAMSCVACHMVGDAQGLRHAGMRGYTDFVSRTPIPHLDTDDLATTPRNTPTLIDAFVERTPFLLHFDGEFASIEDLVKGSWIGRNFGWTPGEAKVALANIVQVVREDDGHGALARQFGGGSYREMLKGTNPSIPQNARISRRFRMTVLAESDENVLNRAVELVKVYLQALQFARDSQGNHMGSAYDHFLLANDLPREPDDGESADSYATRLSFALLKLVQPKYVHDDAGVFDEKELTGLRIFLARSTRPSARGPGFYQAGNCVACHAPPQFTDFRFHNTGVSQEEYDSLHGEGSFAELHIPSLAERSADPDAWLPGNGNHPDAREPFRKPPRAGHPELTDLGAWNIFLNPDYPASQPGFALIFCPQGGCGTDAGREQALGRAVAAFKTPGLRELGMSDPYLHNGSKPTIESVLRFYAKSAELERAGKLRNGDPELGRIRINEEGVRALSAFLNSLNEDYE